MTSQKAKSTPNKLLWVILIIQLATCIFVGFQKQGYHFDEMLAYYLANRNSETAIATGEWLCDEWLEPSDFMNSIEVLSGHRFDYISVYRNETTNVHPPLFYALLHTVCSFFPSTFSKWYGLSINAVCLLLCTLVLQRICMRLFRMQWLSLVAAAAFGFSVGAFSNFSFVRMYSLMMLLATCLFYLHIRLYQDGYSRKLIILIAACVFLGVMTHYYFIVLTCFLALFFTIVLLYKKNFKTVKAYVLSVLGAGAACCLIYPAMLKHIFSGYRGVEAFENFTVTDNLFADYKTVFGIINGQLFGDILQYVLLAAFLAILAKFIIVSSRKERNLQLMKDSNTPLILILALTVVFYFLIVAKVSPYLADRYFFAIYPISVVLAAYLLYYVIGLFIKNKALIFSGVLIGMALMTALSYKNNEIAYQYKEEKDVYATIELYDSYDCVVAMKTSTNYKVRSIITFLSKFDNIFVLNAGDPDSSFASIDESHVLSDKLVVFVEQSVEQEPILQAFLENLDYQQYTQLQPTGYFSIYLFE